MPEVVVKGDITYTIDSKQLIAKSLKPPKNFSNVLAKELKVEAFEAVQYSKDKNLIVMKISAILANLEDFSIKNSIKEEIKKVKLSFPNISIVYYTIIPSNIDKLEFSYFNIDTKEFKNIKFDISVKDESVSTQSDIRPSEDKNRFIKIALFMAFGAIFAIFAIYKKAIFSGILGAVFIGYGLYLLLPMKKVCIKKDAKIFILPTKNSTVFKINHSKSLYEELGRTNGYIKIKLSNKNVGWVKDEDSCKN